MLRVLAVCPPDNDASIPTITHHGDVSEALRATRLGPTRCYRIDLTLRPGTRAHAATPAPARCARCARANAS